MTAVFSAIAAATLISAGVQHHNQRKSRKQAERFHAAEQKRIQDQTEQARIAHNIDRERTDGETANIQDRSSDQLISTGKRKHRQVNSGNISSSLGL